MKSPKPYSVGRIVMYVPDQDAGFARYGNSILPGIIVHENHYNDIQKESSSVNLKVFTNATHDLHVIDVPYDGNKTPGTWHWPEIK